jgi:hypothetical protein
MADWIEMAILLAFLAAGPAIALVFELRARFRGWSHAMPTVPAEPCWTEDIPSDRRYACGRAQCVNDELMAADERMRWEMPTGSMGG